MPPTPVPPSRHHKPLIFPPIGRIGLTASSGPSEYTTRCSSRTSTLHTYSLAASSFFVRVYVYPSFEILGLDDPRCPTSPSLCSHNISDSEGEEVEWYSKKGHGTRNGAITLPRSYIQIAAYLHIGGTDGGELDSGGQDGEGNPMGGLVCTNAFKASNGDNRCGEPSTSTLFEHQPMLGLGLDAIFVPALYERTDRLAFSAKKSETY
ncbi:hypothetical protein C8R45DRAFT_1190295 [Mycena sanguinolenta]|nr:hypothetical protein C8R45DRAFT_1190295 [Mycena sanguinolenta]